MYCGFALGKVLGFYLVEVIYSFDEARVGSFLGILVRIVEKEGLGLGEVVAEREAVDLELPFRVVDDRHPYPGIAAVKHKDLRVETRGKIEVLHHNQRHRHWVAAKVGLVRIEYEVSQVVVLCVSPKVL